MKKSDVLAIIVILFLSLYAIRSLFASGSFYTHDDIFHIARIANYIHEIEQGQLPVRIATRMGNGFSYPIFNFVYPLPYMFISAIYFLFGISITASTKVVLIASTILSSLAFYTFIKQQYSTLSSLLATTLYLYIPYRFLTLFVTGQLGTLMAFFCAPFVFLFAQKMLDNQNNKPLLVRYGALFSVSVCLLLLAHLISAVIVLPLVAIYILLEIYQKNKKFELKTIQPFIIPTILGVLLSSFYLIPSILESTYVKAGHEEIVTYVGHFVSPKQLLYSKWGYGFSEPGYDDLISFQLGLVQWILLAITCAVVVLQVVKLPLLATLQSKILRKQNLIQLTVYVAIILISVFLMTEYSDFLWRSLPVLPKLQHPWRLLLVPTIIIPIIAAGLLESIKNKKLQFITCCVLIILAFYFNRNYQRSMESTRYPDEHYLENKAWLYGSGDVAWEFLPVTAQQPSTAPQYIIHPGLLKNQNADQTISNSMSFDLAVPEEQLATLNIIYYPNWQVLIDGRIQEITLSEDGLITVLLPSGEHTLTVQLRQTHLQLVANALSILTLLLLVFQVLKTKKT